MSGDGRGQTVQSLTLGLNGKKDAVHKQYVPAAF